MGEEQSQQTEKPGGWPAFAHGDRRNSWGLVWASSLVLVGALALCLRRIVSTRAPSCLMSGVCAPRRVGAEASKRKPVRRKEVEQQARVGLGTERRGEKEQQAKEATEARGRVGGVCSVRGHGKMSAGDGGNALYQSGECPPSHLCEPTVDYQVHSQQLTCV